MKIDDNEQARGTFVSVEKYSDFARKDDKHSFFRKAKLSYSDRRNPFIRPVAKVRLQRPVYRKIGDSPVTAMYDSKDSFNAKEPAPMPSPFSATRLRRGPSFHRLTGIGVRPSMRCLAVARALGGDAACQDQERAPARDRRSGGPPAGHVGV